MKRIWWGALALFIVAAGVASVGFAKRLAWRPGRSVELAVDVEHPYDDGVSADVAFARTVERLRGRADQLDAHLTVSGRRIRVVLARDAAMDHVLAQLTRPARLEFATVDDGSDYMKRVAASLAATPLEGVELGHDSWTEKDSGAPHSDVYLRATDRDALTSACETMARRVPLPADRRFVLERRDDGDGAASWRTYLVARRAAVTGDVIDDVEVNWDAQTGRPEVAIGFNADGAKLFEALTATATGHKLAIILDGRINSAPVVEGKISGGHARITLGGQSDPFALQQEAKDLVAVLRVGGLAAPVRVVSESRPANER